MKKSHLMTILAILAVFIIFGYSQESSDPQQSIVINVEVPVRVFKDGSFINNLTIKDFEIYENDELQKIEAVYLVKKRAIERSEENRRFTPETNRNFYFFFEIMNYTPKLGRAIEYFVDNILFPGDDLTIVTPMKTYQLRSKALEVKSRDEIVNQLKGLLRKDALIGSSEYRHVIFEMENIVKSLTAEIEQVELQRVQMDGQGLTEDPNRFSIGERLLKYYDLQNQLERLRRLEQDTLLGFADFLKDKEGQKYVYLFYQREFIPKIEVKSLQYFESQYQERPHIMATMSDIFNFYRRDISFDVDLVKKRYADSNIAVHFLFISSPKEQIYGIRYQEHSEDIFSAFQEMARATGGYVESSANPEHLFSRAVASSENYYLLYYTPKNYKPDGKFKDIRIKVKNKSFRVTHRMGYFAN